MIGQVTDAMIDRIARAIWDADMDAHKLLGVLGDRSYENAKDIYRRRAEAAVQAMAGESTVEDLAFALWSYARFSGSEPLHELGSWSLTQDEYLNQAEWIIDDLNRKGRRHG